MSPLKLEIDAYAQIDLTSDIVDVASIGSCCPLVRSCGITLLFPKFLPFSIWRGEVGENVFGIKQILNLYEGRRSRFPKGESLLYACVNLFDPG